MSAPATTERAALRGGDPGVLAGIAAYGMWGVFPLYFHLLRGVLALEVLAHRVLWTLVVTVGIVAARRNRRSLGAVLGDRRAAGIVAAAALLVSLNWGVYIWAVQHDRVVEAALGYFINPLVTVALGVIVLGERLRRMQWAAVAVGVVAVGVLTAAYGRIPWVALVLAFSFAGYAFCKNRVPLPAVTSLAAETIVLAPLAIGLLGVLAAGPGVAFGSEGLGTSLLLAASGPITAAPLLCFAAAARRIPLTMIGLLQYLTPTLQFLMGVLVLGEQLSAARWAGFVLVWCALALLSADAVLRSRQRSRV